MLCEEKGRPAWTALEWSGNCSNPVLKPLFLQLPGGAVGAAQEFGGFFVADDDFLFGVPFDRTFYEHGDQRQMAWNGGVMRGFHRRDRRFARFDTIEEIPMVIGGPVEFDFALVFGKPRHVLKFLF